MEEKKKRIVIKIGDVFCAEIDDQYKMYFQYTIDDRLQLNSMVIRVFKTRYTLDADPRLEDVVKDEVFFYAHVMIRWGIRMNLWYKVGKVKFEDPVNVLFRDSLDYGAKEKVDVSHRWNVWLVGDPGFTYVGKLTKEYQHAEIGVVKAPNEIVERMRTGKYSYRYPRYE